MISKKVLKCSFFVSLSFAVATTPMHSLATGLIAGATEPTQLLNNGQLILSYVEQMITRINTVTTASYAIKQYLTMMQNLQNLPASMVEQIISPYRSALSSLNQLHTQFKRTKDAVTGLQAVTRRRLEEMRDLGMNPNNPVQLQEYISSEISYAKAKGGQAKEEMENDIKQLEMTQSTISSAMSAADQMQFITGAVEGQQKIGQMTAQLVAEISSLKSLALRNNIRANSDQEEKEYQSARENQYMKEMLEANKKQRKLLD